MSIVVRDVNNGLGVKIYGSGTITGEEFIEVMEKHLTQDKERFRQYRYSLSDYTNVNKFELSVSDIQYVAGLCKTAAMANPDAIVAIVADKNISYGLSRMWQILTDDTDWEINIFRNRDEAEVWIRIRANEKHGIKQLSFE